MSPLRSEFVVEPLTSTRLHHIEARAAARAFHFPPTFTYHFRKQPAKKFAKSELFSLTISCGVPIWGPCR